MVIIGITGPTGAGKTTALKEVESLGGAVLDCDLIYHGLLADSQEMRRALEDEFGRLDDGRGAIDRKKLGEIVFHDPKRLLRLNAITHHHVGVEVDRLLVQAEREGRPAAAIDAIGLFESGIDRRCHMTVAVIAPREARIARIMAREGLSQDYAAARVDAQKPAEYYIKRCTHCLMNDGEPADFAARARRLFASILK